MASGLPTAANGTPEGTGQGSTFLITFLVAEMPLMAFLKARGGRCRNAGASQGQQEICVAASMKQHPRAKDQEGSLSSPCRCKII